MRSCKLLLSEYIGSVRFGNLTLSVVMPEEPGDYQAGMERNMNNREQLKRLSTFTMIGASGGLAAGMIVVIILQVGFAGVGMVVAGLGMMVGMIMGAGIGAIIE